MKKKKRWFLKAELLVLFCIVILWIVDLRTDCVPRAAAGALRQVVKVAPNCGYAHELLSDTYTILGRHDDAFEASAQADFIACKRAVHLDPNDAEAYFNLGNAYYDSNDFEQAIESYEAAIRLDPKNMDAYGGLSACYWETGPFTKAVETWKRALEVDPDYNLAHLDLAFNYANLGRYEEAIAKWKYLIELEPDIAVLYVFLGRTYYTAGRYTEAVTAYKRALTLNPKHEQAHYELGKVYLQMDDEDLALKEYEILKGLDKELADNLFNLIGKWSPIW